MSHQLKQEYLSAIRERYKNTTWTENRALWGKSSAQVILAMREIEAGLPYKLRGFKSDSGSEFINHELMAYFRENRTD